MSKFTRKGQGIDILDGRVINLAIDYTIVVAPGLNKTQVKFDTLLRVKDLFDINNWQLNQSLIIDDIICEIKKVEGVVSVANINIVNRNNQFDGRTYSTEVFSPEASSRNGIIFAPQNSIFEIKFKDGVDIKVGAL